MKLTCPNCGAQYEVPDAVIPAAGRDVQCSNCGTTWFQHHSDHAPSEPAVPDATPDPSPEPQPAPAAQRRLDPSVADILRQEADRERAARAAEADGRIETQPDLGLGAPDPDEARERVKRLRGAPPADDGTVARGTAEKHKDEGDAIDPRSRPTLFPDIEEINSSLSASDDGKGAPAPEMAEHKSSARRGSGFRTGFLTAVVCCVIALVIYLMAPRIAGLWPAAEAPLTQYVQAVDEGRALLASTVANVLARF